MSPAALDPPTRHPQRLRTAATPAALPGGDAPPVTRRQDMTRLPPGIRAGDADRDAAAAAPGEHFAQGRLTLHEPTARLDPTMTATTHGELSQATRDLPDPTALPARISLPRRKAGNTSAQTRPSPTPRTKTAPLARPHQTMHHTQTAQASRSYPPDTYIPVPHPSEQPGRRNVGGLGYK